MKSNVGFLSFESWEFVFRKLGICPQNVGVLSLMNIGYSFITQWIKESEKAHNTSNIDIILNQYRKMYFYSVTLYVLCTKSGNRNKKNNAIELKRFTFLQ